MRADDVDKSAPAPESVRRLADKVFLGPEFVTWLYFTLLEEGLEIELPGAFVASTGVQAPEDNIVRFAIGKRTVLKTLDPSGAKCTLSGPGLDDNGELLQAIRRGALVDSLSLEAAIDSRVYAFSLNANDGGLSGVKLPDLFTDQEDEDEAAVQALIGPPMKKKSRPKLPFEDVLTLRMQCLDELERVIDALFERFVTRRLARAWVSEDVRSIRRRVSVGLKARIPESA
jgi:hypothetical protein